MSVKMMMIVIDCHTCYRVDSLQADCLKVHGLPDGLRDPLIVEDVTEAPEQRHGGEPLKLDIVHAVAEGVDHVDHHSWGLRHLVLEYKTCHDNKHDF